jgi:hypothetical protein
MEKEKFPITEHSKESKKAKEQKESILLAETYQEITEKAKKLRDELYEIEKTRKEKGKPMAGVSIPKIEGRELEIKYEMQVLGAVENILRFRKENKDYRTILYQIPDNWDSPDKLTKVKFEPEGIEGLDVYYEKMGRFINADTLKFPNPLMARDIISYLYQDRRLALSVKAQQEIMSKLKSGEKERWATDYENIAIIFERTKVPSATGEWYPGKLAQMKIEVEQEY